MLVNFLKLLQLHSWLRNKNCNLSIYFKKDDDVKNLEATDGNKLVRLSEREGRDLLNDDLDVVELTINEVKYTITNY